MDQPQHEPHEQVSSRKWEVEPNRRGGSNLTTWRDSNAKVEYLHWRWIKNKNKKMMTLSRSHPIPTFIIGGQCRAGETLAILHSGWKLGDQPPTTVSAATSPRSSPIASQEIHPKPERWKNGTSDRRTNAHQAPLDCQEIAIPALSPITAVTVDAAAWASPRVISW